jgi:ATP-binding cassette subfamily F protein 3
MSVLRFHGLKHWFGDLDLFSGVTGEIPDGAKIGLVGPNGIGKTTLLQILAGRLKPVAGAVTSAKSITLGYLEQESELAFRDLDHTVYEEMLTAFADLRQKEARLRELEAQMAEGAVTDALLQRYGSLQEAFESGGGYEYEVRVQTVLTGLGFPDDQMQLPLHHCSGGQKTRALLARLLLEEPDLLILDEPTNHLDVEAVEWLEETLRDWEGALLVVSHDRYFLDQVVDTIWELARRGLEVYRGNYSAFQEQREMRWAEHLEAFDTVKEGFLKDLDFIKRNIVRASTTGRAQGLKKRLERKVRAVEVGGVQAVQQKWSHFMRNAELSKVRWRMEDLESHIKALQRPQPAWPEVSIKIPASGISGNEVLRAQDVAIGYPGTPLFNIEELLLLRGECAALIGPNGSGKSTFLRTLMGEVDSLRGTLRLGASLDIRYFSQSYQIEDPEHTVLKELLSHQPMLLSEARSYLAQYGFRKDEVFKPLAALSGGERSRFAMAVLALEPANLLLLDEPTNHLDLPSQEALQEALADFPGTLLLVSHDRYLVNALATQIWVLHDGRLHIYQGNYAAYQKARRRAEAEVRAAAEQAATDRNDGAGDYVRASGRGAAVRTEHELERVEAQIEEMEQALVHLDRALFEANELMEWTRVQELNVEYQATQADLDDLMSRWERLAEAQV